MEEAAKFTKRQKLIEKQREEDEKKLFGAPERSNNDSNETGELVDASVECAEDVESESIGISRVVDDSNFEVDDHIWKWSDADQVTFSEVKRINVNDPDASEVVTQARIVGTPLVLVGHVGWANFAKRWLAEKKDRAEEGAIHRSTTESKSGTELGGIKLASAKSSNGAGIERGVSSPDNDIACVINDVVARIEQAKTTEFFSADAAVHRESLVENETKGDSQFDVLLDLSKAYELDIKKMISDIGDEDVPIIKRHYNEEKPIHGKIAAEKFLLNCWPTSESEADSLLQDKTTKCQKNSSSLYLHQWQFPLSDTAGRKLCHQSNPLPKGVLGEDLLKYWLDLPQCKLDSPLQYIFMGREDTLSKLHKDPGGLEISIAPIVGQKECVLVHRDDGSNCMYNLGASLEDIDLHRYPLLFQARIWKTVIKPGEILLMPYGTYHQVRLLSPTITPGFPLHCGSNNLRLLMSGLPEVSQCNTLSELFKISS